MIKRLIQALRKRIFDFYSNSKLKYKLIVAFSICIIFSVLLIGSSSYYISKQYMLDSEEKSHIQNMNRLNNTIDYFFETFMNRSQVLFSNLDLQAALVYENKDIAEVVNSQKKINNILAQLINDLKNPEMKNSYYFGGNISVEIYAMNDSLTSFNNEIMPYDSIKNEYWCRELFDSKKLFSWQSGVVLNGSQYIAISRKMLDFSTTKDIGVLRIYIPIARIKNILEKNVGSTFSSFIYEDENFNKILTFGPQISDKDFSGELKDLDLDEGIKEMSIGNGRYIVGMVNSDITGWKLIYFTPVSLITGKIKYITYITLAMVTVSIFMCMLLATSIASFITRRINILVDKTNHVRDGNISVNKLIEGTDEIGQLDSNFNRMIHRINDLIENDYKSKIVINKTKLDILQEQINPHLLYNTLSVIGSMSKRSNQPEILDVTNNMINFYKGILNKGKLIASLRSEVEMIKRYIDIIKLVYAFDIETVFDIEEEILDCYSIKLFMQPIVENSIEHGLKPNKSGTIVISGYRVDEDIEFVISDDGIGMEEEVRADLRNSIGGDSGKGYGLSNVIRRINLFFGEKYGVTIESFPNAGTTVIVRIPAFNQDQIKSFLESRYLL